MAKTKLYTNEIRLFFHFFFFMLSYHPLCAQEANGKITNGKRVRYKLTYKPRVGSDLCATEYMDLIFDEKQSYFESGQKSSVDSLKKTRQYQLANREEKTQMRLKYYTEIPEIVQTIPSKGEVHYTTFVLGSNPTLNVQYTEKFSPVWKLSKETKDIAGLKCTKATTTAYGRSWTAWYSLELPVPYGPYKFYGLPGIIVKLSDADNDFVYEMKKVEKGTHSYEIDSRFTDITKVDKRKALQIKNNEHHAMLSRIISATVTDANGKEIDHFGEMSKNLEERTKAKNHIELTLEP